ncbi:hypothetical protein [Erythrobacter sp. HL-111]|uniref:hypothetical protein n=1 Tax=Erythrobacter sp. HL-111 TaxID=1798193 RepID=UPI0006DB42CB|nr:hypothetical protein [Erythrobacter sp. HL-111]KPP87956.1 MAG: TAT (twin-arginine translocation) pathway signal sequence [Erythrobacteraceae bacterium HL-111]SDS43669.1 hypothetical protein SAMN04515621_1561 [Erythrobacter sp. HL-111]
MACSRRSFLAGASALALTACGGGGSKPAAPPAASPSPSPTPGPTPTPSPAPTPTPTPAPSPAPSPPPSGNDPYDPTATALDPYLAAITRELVLTNAKARDYRVSLVETSLSRFRMHIWDEQLGRQVAFFELRDPDYDDLPERILLNSTNPLDSRQFSGMQGWIKLDPAGIVPSAAVFQFATFEEGRINRRNVSTRSDYTDRHWADGFDEVIAVGPTREFTTIRAALESLYDGGPLADPDNPSQLPVCLRANPFHRIALVFDPKETPYLGVSEHVPDWVWLGGRTREGVVFEHAPGAQRSIIEGHANTGAFDLTIRATAPPGSGGSLRYGWHTDHVHVFQTPDSEGEVNRNYTAEFRRVRFVVGPRANAQVFGAGIGVQAAVIFRDCVFDCENSGYRGILAAANNSSGTIGGGRFTFVGCRDASGRTGSPATIGVQAKTRADEPGVVRIDDCADFRRIALSGDHPGQWRLTGNTPMEVVSQIPGDDMTG